MIRNSPNWALKKILLNCTASKRTYVALLLGSSSSYLELESTVTKSL